MINAYKKVDIANSSPVTERRSVDGCRRRNHKGASGNLLGDGLMDTIKCLNCALSFHGVPMSAFIKFCTLKMCSLLYISKLSLKVKNKSAR